MTEVLKGALLSPDRVYRYSLHRIWDPAASGVTFIGLNPSTADENEDDPTIRRCMGFAKKWGYGGIRMVNLFAYRATDPKDMRACLSPIGPDNNAMLSVAARNSGLIVCAWGANGDHMGRGQTVAALLSQHTLYCLGVTQAYQPKHPLYLKADTKPIKWRP